jgi:hypothetical protein
MPLKVDLEQFGRDVGQVLLASDVTILVAMVEEHQQCPDRHPGSATARRLGLSHGRVRHRSFKSMTAMKAHPHLEEHLWYLSEVVFRQVPALTSLAG